MSNIQTQTRIFRLESALAKADDEITALRTEVERLRAGYQGACYACEPVGELNLKLTAEVEAIRKAIPDAFILDPPDGGDVKTIEGVQRLTARVAELEEALKPFADAWASIPSEVYRNLSLAHLGAIAKHEVSGTHFHRARAALSQPSPPKETT